MLVSQWMNIEQEPYDKVTVHMRNTAERSKATKKRHLQFVCMCVYACL